MTDSSCSATFLRQLNAGTSRKSLSIEELGHLLKEAKALHCQLDGIQAGLPGVFPPLLQFTLHDPNHPDFHPTVYVAENEPFPAARLKDLISDCIRKHTKS